jgi:translation initiation factor 2 subunit 2
MSEEPLFDPSLKKRKKKAVAFTEDPLGPEADPTAPAPDVIDDTTTAGEKVDLGPKTAHEAMSGGDGGAGEEDDFKAMFGDLKKKSKKKKEVPMDLDLVRLIFYLWLASSTCSSPQL